MVLTVKRNSKTPIAANFLIKKKQTIKQNALACVFMHYSTVRSCCSLLASKIVMDSCKSVFLKLCESMTSLFASSVFMQLLNWQQLSFSGGGKSECSVITGYKCLWTLSCVQQLKAFSCSLPTTNADNNYSLLCTLLPLRRTLPGPFASPKGAVAWNLRNTAVNQTGA